MMIKKIYQSAFILLVLISTSSCKKWLDLQPQDGITKQEFWKTKEDVKAALTGIYSSLVGGSVEERIFAWGELRGDMVTLTTYASEDFRQVRNSNILTTNSISNWSSIYNVINNCNLLIDFAGDAKALDPTFTDRLYNDYVGEALTIRSLMYFYLVRSFRDVPLKLKGSYKDTDIQEIGKSTAAEVIAQIISDLNKAKTMVPHKVSDSDQVNKGRITRYAVFSLLADVYLWNEQYQEALTATDSVLINPDFKLVKGNGFFLSVFGQGSSSETIFELSHQSSVSNVFYSLLADGRRIYTASEYVPTEIFPSNTQVDVELVDGRSNFYDLSSTIRKYGTDNPNFTNFQVYRISDVMLMQAEALNQIGGKQNGDKALAILKNIRDERGALDATDPEITDGDDTEGIGLFILDERAREFAFEGKRWFDLLRYAKRDNYANISILQDLISKISDVTVQQSALNKIRDTNSHYFPILESELYADTKLVQNPFYLK
ncbi:MAG TPA: RagB/SusD family nutrient uptake outer membrane protein [Pelobium sp.]|nr:RagB/SusD family nutrient uptake outer membrane protein [Pelobium sp.]